MTKLKMALIAGFAMFSMFFGSGNLVFPLTMGAKSLEHFPYAAVGLLLTGIIIPFVGLISVIAYQGNRQAYFSTIGSWAPFTLSLIMLSLIGPFGVIPRCMLVAFGGVQLIWPQMEAWTFGLIFIGITGYLIWQRHTIVDIIGRYLTPVKLGSILLLVVAGLFFSEVQPIEGSTITQSESFLLGVTQGYQTMDLLAAFFFSVTIVRYLRRCLSDDEDVAGLIKTSLMATLIGAAILTFVYIAFVFLGAKYGNELMSLRPENGLVAVTGFIFKGTWAKVLAACILFFACLTTATILSSLFADFLTHDICRDRIPREIGVILTLAITFVVSLFGFGKIAMVMDMILTFLYPALIVFALANLIDKIWGLKTVKPAFYLTVVGCIIFAISPVFIDQGQSKAPTHQN